MARDLAGRAERATLTRRDLDVRPTVNGHRGDLRGIGRRTLSAVTMKVLHQKQMKLDHCRCPDHQPAVRSTSAVTPLQNRSKPELKLLLIRITSPKKTCNAIARSNSSFFLCLSRTAALSATVHAYSRKLMR